MLNDLTDVRKLLKRFGVIIYTGDRLDDIALMEIEIGDLYEFKLIEAEEFIKAKSILAKEYLK